MNAFASGRMLRIINVNERVGRENGVPNDCINLTLLWFDLSDVTVSK